MVLHGLYARSGEDGLLTSGARTFGGAMVLWLGLLLAPLVAMGQGTRRNVTPYKSISGARARSDSHQQVYFHEQTIAIVETVPHQQLVNCELIEVLKPQYAKQALKELSSISKPVTITFRDMHMLMSQCHGLDTPSTAPTNEDGVSIGRRSQDVNPLTILSGIVPGTKWCGAGDIAKTYFDLGPHVVLDKCCRSHDLCPVKVKGFQSRYNLTNLSFYTKSHCDCDSMLYDCLKASKNPTAQLMGNLYFNIIRIPCIEDIDTAYTENKKKFRQPYKQF